MPHFTFHVFTVVYPSAVSLCCIVAITNIVPSLSLCVVSPVCAAALAEDHFNDVISNAAAMVTAAIAFHTTLWWFDPVGEKFALCVQKFVTRNTILVIISLVGLSTNNLDVIFVCWLVFNRRFCFHVVVCRLNPVITSYRHTFV